MLNELRQARDEISMEALSNEAADQVAAKIPSFLDKAAEFLSKSVLQKIGDFFGSKDLGWIAVNAARRPYSEVRGIQLDAPQGFKGSLVEYGHDLVKAVEATEDLEKDVLAPYGTWVAQRVEDPASLRSVTNTLKIPGLQYPKVESLQKNLDGYFPDKASTDGYVYGDLIRRQGDWAELNNIVKKLNTLYANGKFEKLQKKLPDVSDMVGLLAKRLNEGEGDIQFSPITVEQLSKVTIQVAEHVEFAGVLRHRVDEYIKAIGNNAELVKSKI